MRVGFAFMLAACGARTELAGGGMEQDAASFDVSADVTFDFPHDASPDVVFSSDGAACSTPQVAVTYNGPGKTACKAQVTITCGAETYQLRGGCDLPDAGWPDAESGGNAVCTFNGKDGTPFNMSTCSCDPSAWSTLLVDECLNGHQ
jgi:hypothetical protein